MSPYIPGCKHGRWSYRSGDSRRGYDRIRGLWLHTGQDSPLQGDHSSSLRCHCSGHDHLHFHAGLWIHCCGLLQQYLSWVSLFELICIQFLLMKSLFIQLISLFHVILVSSSVKA